MTNISFQISITSENYINSNHSSEILIIKTYFLYIIFIDLFLFKNILNLKKYKNDKKNNLFIISNFFKLFIYRIITNSKKRYFQKKLLTYFINFLCNNLFYLTLLIKILEIIEFA